jgi:uncharacterized membrane protein
MKAMKRTSAHLLRVFVTGLLTALPLAATIAIFWWAVDLLIGWLGPKSMVGGLLVSIGFGVTGSDWVGYLLGVALVAALIFALGLVVEAGFQRGVAKVMEAVVRRIPLVGTVYELLRKMVALFAQRDERGHASMRAVWCHFGGVGGAAVLALQSTPQPLQVGGHRYLAVLVPTAPVPVGGGLLFVPEEWVTPADIGIEALTSIYVSMGVTSPEHLAAPRRA